MATEQITELVEALKAKGVEESLAQRWAEGVDPEYFEQYYIETLADMIYQEETTLDNIHQADEENWYSQFSN